MQEYFINELDHFPYAYDEGQFHRVHVGEVYNHRYRVYRKLGFGCSSTVWLVKDIATGRWRAMKVLSAAAYNGEADLFELEILQHLQAGDVQHPGRAHTLQLIDHFDHKGTGGLHRCLVFPVMGESLLTYVRKFQWGRVPPNILKRLTLQLLLGLEYAHSRGVIHTDVKLENVMIEMTDESIIDDWFLPNTGGCTEPEGLEPESDSELSFLFWPNSDRLHPSKVPCIPLANYYLGREPSTNDFENVKLVISDWGVATWQDPARRVTDEVVPLVYRSPELLLKAPWDEKVDIWSLGCLIYELAERDHLFTGEGPIGDDGWGYNSEWHLLEMTEILGDIPANLLEAGNPDIVGYAFNQEGKMVAARAEPCPPLPAWVRNMSSVEQEDFVDMLDAMFTLDPASRLTASHLQNAPWLEITSPQLEPTPLSEEVEDVVMEEASHGPVEHDADATMRETEATGIHEWIEEKDTTRSEGTDATELALESEASEFHKQKRVKLSSGDAAIPEPPPTEPAAEPVSVLCGPFLESGNGRPAAKGLSGRRGSRVNVIGTATKRELAQATLWFIKEAVVNFFSLLKR